MGVFLVLGFSAQAQEDFTYLYYFESDDANLSEVDSKEYAFATLRGERVTIVVYGLDALVRPRLRIFNAAGAQIGVGRTPPDQPYITFFQINATGNDLYTFRVERAGGEGGLARVMLFEGDPLNQDLTLLDDINPLLPSRAFMVAGRDNEEGLRVLVEVLDVPYYDQRPLVFASRGTLTELPDVTERFNPSDTFLWFNRDVQQVYFINIRPTPEESTIVTEDIPLPLFNVGNFFYFDYYFTVGAGSDPIRLVTRQDCTTAPNRPECVRESPTFGRSEINLPPPPPDAPSVEIFRPDRGDLPPVQECVGGIGEVRFFTSPVVYTSTDCDDFLSGSEGNDRLAGGPGNDTILGNGGDDIIFGDEGDDELFGGAGNDFIDGGSGNDLLSGGPGNDTLEGGPGIDTVTYADSPDAVTVNLTNHRNPLIGGTASSVSQGNDLLFNIEAVIGTNFNDSITGSSDNDLLFGLDGNDTLFGNGGNDTIHAGAGNDEVRIGSPLNGNSVITLGLGNDLVLINGPGSANISGGDETGPISNDGNDSFVFLNGASGTFQLFSQWGDDVIDFSALASGVTFNLSSLVLQNPFGSTFIRLLDDSINVLLGTAFDDVLTGSSVNKNCDYIDAGAGNDLVFATASNGADCGLFDSALTNDTLIGGAGNDTVSYALLADVNVNLLTGTAAKNGGTMFDTLSGFENVIGSPGNDTITGDNQANILAGGLGDDLIFAGGGNDTIIAGFGSDTIDGGTGVNLVDFSTALTGREIRLDGVLADDLITNVSDVIGTNFNDIIMGSAGNNVINAGAGNDLINVNAGAFGSDTVSGGAGRDTLNSALQDLATTVTINAGNGTLTNSNGAVTFDTIEAVVTGIGNDSFQIDNGLALITNPFDVDGGGGVNTYNFAGTAQGYVRVTPNISDLLTVDNASAANFSGLIVNEWQQILTNLFVLLTAPINPSCGASGDTVFLNFTNNNDVVGDAPLNLTSCASDDIFNGLAGFDIITYATVPLAVGDLIFTIVNGPQNQVAIVESTSGSIGTDTIRNFERIVGRTGGRDIFAFQPLTSLISLEIDGNGGNDQLDFSAITTPVTINLSLVTPQSVYNNMQLTLLSPIREVLLGAGNDTLIGSSGNDLIFGNDGDDSILGGDGNDTIWGGAGNDIIFGGIGNDEIRGGLGNDTVFGGSGDDTFIETDADGGSDSYRGGDGNDLFLMVLDGANDLFFGEGGYDIFQYTNDTPVVGTVGTISTFIDGSGFDILSTIEEIITGGGNDNILLDAGGISVLRTGAGNDTVTSASTSTTPFVFLDAGDDLFIAQGPTLIDMLVDGGTGTNALIVNNDAVALPVTINAATTTVSGDTYLNFASLTMTGSGSEVVTVTNDSFTTSVVLGAGNDLLVVQLDSATNTYDGGSGTDTADYSALGGNLTLVLDTDTTIGNDTIRNFEALVLGNANYTITEQAGSPFTTITTGSGTDVVTLNGDNLTTLNTGAGNDSVTVTAFTTNTAISMGAGDDSLTYATGLVNLTVAISGPLSGTVSDGAVTDTFSGVELLTLAGGADTININTNAGGLTVNAGAGADVFNVGSGAMNATLLGGAGDDLYLINFGPATGLVMDAGAGNDTANYTPSFVNLIVTLDAGVVVTDGIFVQTLVNFENLLLGAGSDFVEVIDDSLLSTINLGAGNDFLFVQSDTAPNTYDGGAGVDTADYSALGGNLTLVLDTDTTIGNDTIRNFEALVLGNANYTITEQAGSPFTTITTGSGTDVVTLNGDNLTALNTGAGNDSVTVTAFNTATAISMGAGDDSLTYSTGTTALTVAISGVGGGTVSDGAVTDTFSGVELLTLAGGADAIAVNVNAGGLVVNAGAGADVFTVGTGASNVGLIGGAGDDTFVVAYAGQSGVTLTGGTGLDTADYSGNVVSLTVTVGGTTSVGTHDLEEIEVLLLGSGADVVTVADDSGLLEIVLGAGNDTLIVQLDSVANTYDGGVGVDTADYSALGGNLTLVLDTDTTIGNDTIRNFEALVLGNANYTITEQAGSPFTTITTGSGTDVVTLNGDNLTALNTGAGNDSVTVTAFNTATAISMGAGDDSLTYSTGTTALTVAISGVGGGTVSDGAVTDTFSGVELLTLAGGADAIAVNVNAGGLVVNAGAGADVFTVGTGASNVGLIGGAGDDTFVVAYAGQSGVTLTGGTGLDTADYSGNVVSLTVTVGGTTSVGTHDLEEIEVLLLGSGADVVTVADDSGLLEIVLGAGNDTLIVQLDSVANTYDGGAGVDTADYSALGGNLTLVLDTDTTIGNDTIRNFEALVLGNANYTITEQGGSPFTTITTGSGTDVVTLNGDNLTTLNTGAGNDSVTVTAFNTNTAINMGAGDDSLTYSTGTTTLTVAISGVGGGTVSDGAVTDTFSGVELLTLAGGADAIAVNVNAGGLVVNAGAGADVFTVGTGASNVGLIGGAGDDTFVVAYAGQSGVTLTGGTGLDTADYSGNVVSLTVTVGGTTSVGTHDLEEIEVLLLGSGADVVTVADDSGLLEIVLGAGNDTLIVQLDSVANTYDGGAGVDTADYSALGGNLTLVLDTDTTIGNDTIRNFEALVLGNANYTITRGAGNPFNAITTGTGNSSVTINNFGDSDLAINLNAGDDSLTYSTGTTALTVALSGVGGGTVSNGVITDTFSGVELLTLAGGADNITVAATSSGVAVNSGAGDDTFNITYNGSVVRDFNAGAHIVADVAIYAGSSNHNVTVAASLITVVVGAGEQDRLTNFEVLTLGSGADSVTITNDTVPYTINLGGGADVVTLAAPTFTGGSTFNGGTGTDTFVVGTAAGTVSTASLAGSTLTLNGTAAYTFNSIETVSIDRTTTGTITVNNPTGVTTLNTSAGADTVTVTNSGSLTAINTGNGNDSINAVNVASTTIINSGAGDDTFRITFNTSDNTFDGGAGTDVANYALDNPTTSFNVDVALSLGTQATVSNGVNTDTLNNFESIITGGGNDVFTINIDNIIGTWTFNAGGSTSGNRFVFVGTGTGTNTAQINLQTASGGQDTLDFSGITGSGVNINAGNTASAQTFVSNTNVTIWLQSVIQNIIGTEQNDVITGTAQNDVILGLGGNDLINGGAGDDTLIGGAGNDTINGGAGNDLIVGDHLAVGSGSQTVGAGGSDVLNGGDGNDTVIGGSLVDCQSAPASTGTAGADGADTLYGGFGNDSIQGDNVIRNCTTTVDGGGGADIIYGGDSVSGNDGNDNITGGPGADTIYGGNQVGGGGTNAGNDTINTIGDSANDTAYGGHRTGPGNVGTNSFNADPGDSTFDTHGP
jgi:Ca2+-binding RTX toxin-like protein